jgi:hypothetical protein
VLLQHGKQLQIARYQIWSVLGMIQFFSTKMLHQLLSPLCCVQWGIVVEENCTIAEKTRTFSSDGLSQAFQFGTVHVGSNCASMSQEVHQQHI